MTETLESAMLWVIISTGVLSGMTAFYWLARICGWS